MADAGLFLFGALGGTLFVLSEGFRDLRRIPFRWETAAIVGLQLGLVAFTAGATAFAVLRSSEELNFGAPLFVGIGFAAVSHALQVTLRAAWDVEEGSQPKAARVRTALANGPARRPSSPGKPSGVAWWRRPEWVSAIAAVGSMLIALAGVVVTVLIAR